VDECCCHGPSFYLLVETRLILSTNHTTSIDSYQKKQVQLPSLFSLYSSTFGGSQYSVAKKAFDNRTRGVRRGG